MILSEEVCKRDASIGNYQDFVEKNRSKGRSKGCNDQVKFNDKSQSRDRSQFNKTRECFYCGKRGHIRRNFWHWNKEQFEGKDENNDCF